MREKEGLEGRYPQVSGLGGQVRLWYPIFRKSHSLGQHANYSMFSFLIYEMKPGLSEP